MNKAKQLIRSNEKHYDTSRFKAFKILRRRSTNCLNQYKAEAGAGQVEYDPKKYQNSKGEFDFRRIKRSYDKELITSNILSVAHPKDTVIIPPVVNP